MQFEDVKKYIYFKKKSARQISQNLVRVISLYGNSDPFLFILSPICERQKVLH